MARRDGGYLRPAVDAGLRALILFSFEEVGVDRRGEGRSVEFDGMVVAVVLRGPSPGGTRWRAVPAAEHGGL